jgi:hypothetical protein
MVVFLSNGAVTVNIYIDYADYEKSQIWEPLFLVWTLVGPSFNFIIVQQRILFTSSLIKYY